MSFYNFNIACGHHLKWNNLCSVDYWLLIIYDDWVALWYKCYLIWLQHNAMFCLEDVMQFFVRQAGAGTLPLTTRDMTKIGLPNILKKPGTVFLEFNSNNWVAYYIFNSNI